MSCLQINMLTNKKDYDLYLSTNFIEYIFVGTSIINNIKKNKEMIFIGISNNNATFIKNGYKLLYHCNNALKSHPACPSNSSIKRIIITNNLTNLKIPIIEPFANVNNFKYNPIDQELPTDSNINIYYVDNLLNSTI